MQITLRSVPILLGLPAFFLGLTAGARAAPGDGAPTHAPEAAPRAGAPRTAAEAATRRATPPARPETPTGAGLRRPAQRPRAPGRKPRVAVLIVATGGVDAELADNLTEVLVVNLATRGRYQVVGKEVIKAQLGGTDQLVLRCINNKTCVGNVSTQLALDYLIVGSLGKFEDTWLYNLYFIEASSAAEKKRVHRRVRGDLQALTTSLDRSLAELLRPKPKPAKLRVVTSVPGATIHVNDQFAGTAPLLRVSPKAGTLRLRVEAEGYYPAERTVRLQAGRTLLVRVRLVPIPPRRKTWKYHLAWAALGTALGAGVVAATTGGLATRKTGTTQVARLRDLERRQSLALVSNVFSGLAGAAAITSAALFLFARKGFYRGGRAERPPRSAWFDITPVRSGAAVRGGVSW